MTKERSKGYHHGNLRAALLAEARQVVESEGENSLSLRACARVLGVDIAASYRHFQNKEEVLAAVAADGFAELGKAMQTAMDAQGRRVEQAEAYLFVGALAYVGFGLAHPHLYRLMFGGRCSVEAIKEQRAKNEALEASADPYALLGDALDLLQKASRLDEQARLGAEFLAWSMVHGMVSLILEQRCNVPKEALEQQVVRGCTVLLRGLSSKEAI